jgi:D-alanine-D-alanine ligase
MNTAKHVLVVMGGDGSEREVSLRTGDAMAAALERSGARVTRFSFRRARLAELAAAECDVALIAVHGQDGEDGHLQAMFEMRQIPYSGSGVAASALAIDKVRSKQLFRLHGVPTPASVVVPRSADAPALPMDTPCVVKASREGSSVGVGICQTESAWADAWATAMAGEGEMLVEAFIRGRELSVGIRDGKSFGVVEIAPADGVYDYTAKYERADTTYLLPAPLSEAVDAAVRTAAERAYCALGCRGVARVDVMLDADEQPWVLEVNTVPGMTATSLVPKMAEAEGISFDAFVHGLVAAATTDRASVGGGAQ